MTAAAALVLPLPPIPWLRRPRPHRQHGPVTADPLADLKAAKHKLDRLEKALPEREARRNSLLADAHADPLTEQELREREELRERGERLPPVRGRGRRAAIARIIGQTERHVRNLYEAELARRQAAGQPRRLEDDGLAFELLADAQAAVQEVLDARAAYYEAIASCLPPHVEGARPSGPEADRFAGVRAITGLDASHLRRIQRAVLEQRAGS
jgi:hypothetical protein